MFGHNGQDDNHDQPQDNQVTEPAAPADDVAPPQTAAAFANPPAPLPDPLTPSAVSSSDDDVDEDDDTDTVTAPAAVAATVGTNDLVDIKQHALQQLSPLVGHLDQSPEEKFRTTMMMIQASDNQNLIKDAYAAAQAITDEKARAQALLDVVNEINYFTQHQDAA